MICTLLSAAMVAMNLILTLYFQHVLGYSPLITGLAFLPHGIAAIFAGPLGGIMANRFGAKAVLVSCISLVLICMALLALITTHDSYWYHVMPVTVIMSFGIMPAFVNLILLATSGTKVEDHGLVSGIVNTTGQLGGAIGLSILIAVAASHTAHILGTTTLSKAEALISGYRMALATGAFSLALALIACIFGLKNRSAVLPSS